MSFFKKKKSIPWGKDLPEALHKEKPPPRGREKAQSLAARTQSHISLEAVTQQGALF